MERITATEVLRRENGPWTPEEIALREKREKELQAIFVVPILGPAIDRMAEIVKILEEE